MGVVDKSSSLVDNNKIKLFNVLFFVRAFFLNIMSKLSWFKYEVLLWQGIVSGQTLNFERAPKTQNAVKFLQN
ncbi:hypothetical protein GCM10007966_06400 [Legionella impletisoli]|uniref:Uncharacterized protein n=1 Tax=Legionella impletisoli TaxID=343510 RepID=A0A917JRQ8_9GAMM|nr:hypothetical protein GCM10007966_06400 [Legionella impletisoli]